MGIRFRGSTMAIAIVSAAVGAVVSMSVTQTTGQTARPARTADGKALGPHTTVKIVRILGGTYIVEKVR